MNIHKQLALLILVLIVLASCSQSPELVVISSPSASPESVYATTDTAGNPVIVWVESDTVEAVHKMFYAISFDGTTFSHKINVPIPDVVNTHAEGMPKVAFMKNGGIIAGYEKSAATPDNKYAGAVYYLYSQDNGKTWTPPRYLHSDTVSGRSRGFFDIQTLPDGNVGASWLDIKSDFKEKGRSIRFAKTNDAGVFNDETVIEPFACECCRTDLYVDAQGGVNVAYRSVRKGNLDQLIRDMAWSRSTDNGATFSAPVLISDDRWAVDRCPHTGPSLGSTTDGLHAIWYTEGNGMGLFYSKTVNGDFVDREQISHSARHPQLVARGDDVFMVYEESSGDSTFVTWQHRGPEGINSGQITEEKVQGYFPVVTQTRDDAYVIAFLGKTGNRRAVFVRKVIPATVMGKS